MAVTPRPAPAATPPAPAHDAFNHRPTPDPMTAATWSQRRVFVTNLRALYGRAYPRLIGLKREPSWLFFEVLLPFLTTSAFVFVYRALQAPPEYIGFVVLGGAMTAFWLNVMWMMAAQLYWEKDQGNLDLYFTTPISLMAVLFGMAVGGLLSSCLRATIVLTVGSLLYEDPFAVSDWFLLLAVFFLTLTALYGLGMVLASPSSCSSGGRRGTSRRRCRSRSTSSRGSTSRSGGWGCWGRWRSPSCRSRWAWTPCASWRSAARPPPRARPRPAWRRSSWS